MRSHNFVESWNKSLALKVGTFFFSPSLLLFDLAGMHEFSC